MCKNREKRIRCELYGSAFPAHGAFQKSPADPCGLQLSHAPEFHRKAEYIVLI